MQYKIFNLRLKNFKCFDNSKYFEFRIESDNNPVILSGPNGFGKTTFFDAVELIFSKNITRLDKEIEKKTTNLGKNILLNKANEDGYVVLTMVNKQKEYLTLFAKILKSNHKLEVENSIFYGEVKEFILTEQLDSYLAGYTEWKNSIDNKGLIKYRAQNFNVYYYVSQAESVHFLKRTISDRKNAMNVLLNTGFIDERKQIVSDLIGSRNGISGYPINDEIARLEGELKKKAIKLKSLSINAHNQTEKIDFVDLGLYKKDSKLFFWDAPGVEELNVSEITSGIHILESIISFLKNESDYENYQWNENITKILKGSSIRDYVDNKEYIENASVSMGKIERQLDAWDTIIKIYNCTMFFRQDIPEAANFKEDDIFTIKKLVPELKDYDFSLIKNIITEILSLRSSFSANQKIIDKLTSARNALRTAKNEYNESGIACPFCNTKFDNVVLLNDGFEEVDKLLKMESGSVGERIALKNKELEEAVSKVKIIIQQYVDGLDENAINSLIQRKTLLKGFVSDSGRVANVDKVVKYLADTGYEPEGEVDNEIIDIQRVLSGLVKQISNEEFNTLYARYNYGKVAETYSEGISEIKKNLSLEVLNNKNRYLAQVIWEKENTEIHEIKNEMRKLIVRKEKATKVRQRLNELSKVYDRSVEEYKNITLKQLRVPLLIYTGKILQDYQNGLGVFISKDEMRFVSNGDAKHDILNTFSSGQLSGFVLAFLFAMNKQYIKASSDDIGFILIDDPVQTMDDINISSLIEVLRNDFSEKQIILSTHEIDKENYILYKFFKYNMVGQSFNVKEEIYG